MKTRTFIITSISLMVAVIIGMFFFSTQYASVVQADSNDNVVGAAWGASDGNGMGWLALNNCEDVNELLDDNCSGVSFGVNIEPDGTFSGAGWSSNYGWVDFNYSNGCAEGSGPEVDLGLVNSSGSAPVEGWLHVYSMSASDGFWDGCIKMNGSWNDGVTLYNDGNIDGVAWGSQVVGWVSFDAVTVATGCTDPDADNYESVALFDDGSCTYTGDYCQNMDVLNDGNLIDSEADFDLMNDQLPSGSQYTQYTIGGFDVCLIDPDDECQNENEFPGVQSSVPADHFQTYIGGVLSCVPVVDVCPTVPGIQTDPNDCPTLPGNFTPPVFQEI